MRRGLLVTARTLTTLSNSAWYNVRADPGLRRIALPLSPFSLGCAVRPISPWHRASLPDPVAVLHAELRPDEAVELHRVQDLAHRLELLHLREVLLGVLYVHAAVFADRPLVLA